ncbi:hypothetical protein FHL15_001312 [Xylaria flabelliformis]|uniref:Uncharacterized protein n=1 Tax=Xylaria flabelliformis TaxID=2512241 RepID=A0A553IBI1_9PEZI|nr:hypothetical protein FHL15_001312 [Xylaria flabelliformis]
MTGKSARVGRSSGLGRMHTSTIACSGGGTGYSMKWLIGPFATMLLIQFPMSATLALDEILDFGSVLALLDKVLRWIDTDERQLGKKLANVLGVILDELPMI